jgi:hypothetical protein
MSDSVHTEKCVICNKTKMVDGYMMWEQGVGYICLSHKSMTVENTRKRIQKKIKEEN